MGTPLSGQSKPLDGQSTPLSGGKSLILHHSDLQHTDALYTWLKLVTSLTNSTEDMLHVYLGNLGYTGSLPDRLYRAKQNGVTFG